MFMWFNYLAIIIGINGYNYITNKNEKSRKIIKFLRKVSSLILRLNER
jgi:hypothetical protein